MKKLCIFLSLVLCACLLTVCGKTEASNNDSESHTMAVQQQGSTISADEFHTVGLRADGTVVACGKNECGQCDVQDWTDIRLPQALPIRK